MGQFTHPNISLLIGAGHTIPVSIAPAKTVMGLLLLIMVIIAVYQVE